MKKYIVVAMLASLILSPALVRAQGETPSRPDLRGFREEMKNRREAFVGEMKKDREAFTAELKTRKEAWKREGAEMKMKFCERVSEIITKRFATVLMQLEKLQTRVSDKIEELEEAGEDTTLAEQALDLSKSKLADAKTKLAEIKALVPENCTNLSPETFAEIKLGSREAKDLLKESRESLHQAVAEIKNLKDNNEEDTE